MNPCWRPQPVQMNATIGGSLGPSVSLMKKLFRVLSDALLIRLGLRVMKFQFMSHDGTRLELDGLRCCTCTNYFWVEHGGIELPPFCCYCGTQFRKTDHISNLLFDYERGTSN